MGVPLLGHCPGLHSSGSSQHVESLQDHSYFVTASMMITVRFLQMENMEVDDFTEVGDGDVIEDKAVLEFFTEQSDVRIHLNIK